MVLPSGLSERYWSSWSAARRGASVTESLAVEREREEGEEWIGTWDGVGLYEGNVNKVPGYQTLSVHLTTHRLILVPESHSSSSSSDASSSSSSTPLQTHLNHVRQTEFYTGFMRSSAKITLFLGAGSASTAPGSTEQVGPTSAGVGWTCRVCGYVNAATSSGNGTSRPKCGLCGVAYSPAHERTPSRTPTPTPTPAPSSNHASHETAVDGVIPSVPSAGTEEIACPACTFLNSPYLPNCEICSTPLPTSKARAQLKSANHKDGGDHTGGGKMDIVRLSFRRGGEKDAYRKLKSVLGDKAWERTQTTVHPSRGGDTAEGEEAPASRSRSGAGIDGILQSIDLSAKTQDEHMRTAFQDLEALMLRAGEMVKLAQSLNQKLSQQSYGPGQQATEEEATMIRNSLVQLGLAAPALTQDMVRGQREYHQGLAGELGALLTGRTDRTGLQWQRQEGREGLMVGAEGRGVIALDEVWGLWMRARGVALLPPKTLIDILPYLPAHTSPSIASLSLPSSLLVLHTPHYSTPAILSRTLDRLAPTPASVSDDQISQEASMSLVEFAAHEGLALALAKEFLEMLEKQGGVVRDDQAGAVGGDGGTRWYRDLIGSYPLQSV